MERIALALIERNCFRPRVKKHRSHVARTRVGFRICHQGVTSTTSTRLRIDHQVIDVQVCAACQRMDGPHPQYADKLAVVKGSDKLVARVRLPADSPQELGFIQRA